MNTITVSTQIDAPISKVWQYWTEPKHVTNWNFASPDWHCPKADNHFTVGGEFHYLMSAKDNSFSFDFWGTYDAIELEKSIYTVLGDNRKVAVTFTAIDANTTLLTEVFEPENQNPVELQQTGWQMILNNFKQYVEGN